MEKINWIEFKKGIEENEEEISFYFHDNEWWISRLYGEPRSFLLTRSKDSYTQRFETAEELFTRGEIEGKTITDRREELYW